MHKTRHSKLNSRLHDTAAFLASLQSDEYRAHIKTCKASEGQTVELWDFNLDSGETVTERDDFLSQTDPDFDFHLISTEILSHPNRLKARSAVKPVQKVER